MPPADGRMVRVIGSDSAKALLLLTKHFVQEKRTGVSQELVIHSRCMMHMFWASLSFMLQVLGVIAPMFCATVLMRKGWNLNYVRRNARRFVAEHLRIVYEKPPADNSSFNQGLMSLLADAEKLLDEDSDLYPERPP